MGLEEISCGRQRLDSTGPGEKQLPRFYERGNKRWGFIRGGKFIDWLNTY